MVCLKVYLCDEHTRGLSSGCCWFVFTLPCQLYLTVLSKDPLRQTTAIISPVGSEMGRFSSVVGTDFLKCEQVQDGAWKQTYPTSRTVLLMRKMVHGRSFNSTSQHVQSSTSGIELQLASCQISNCDPSSCQPEWMRTLFNVHNSVMQSSNKSAEWIENSQ